MTGMPTLYLPHGGGPCFFMEWNPPDEWDRMATWLRSIPGRLPETPAAAIVISGHWEEPVVTVQRNPAPPLLFDYYGFPPHTYELAWPARGSPELADRIAGLLEGAGIPLRFDAERGFDHGVFIPLKVVWPEPEFPVVQVSLRSDLDPAFHIALGRALAPLRDEGVLILGSGMSFHNMEILMRALREPGAAHRPTDPASRQFDEWLRHVLTELAPAERERALIEWEKAPAARIAHPREEHLIPLHVVVGAAGDDRGRQDLADVVMGAAVSAFAFGELRPAPECAAESV